jgi:ABC-type nitrate/sulfonate/bicarbonate transport system permease component
VTEREDDPPSHEPEPAKLEPEPAQPESESAKPEAAEPEPEPEPAKADAAEPEPEAAKAEPAKAEPAKAEPPKPEPEAPPRPPAWWRTLRADPPTHLRMALGATMIAIIVLSWWLLTRGGATDAIISPCRLPSPGGVVGSTGKLVENNLEMHVWATMNRILKGVGYASVVGITLGVIASSFRAIGALFAPIVIFLRSIPMGALFPLVLLIAVGDAEKQKTTFVFLAVLPFIFSDTFSSVAAVPQRYIETAQTLGASRLQIIRKVLVPLALPDIITSLRFQFGLALGYIMLVETNEMQQGGLGALLWTTQRSYAEDSMERVYMLLFIITALAFALDNLIRFFQRGFFRYRADL